MENYFYIEPKLKLSNSLEGLNVKENDLEDFFDNKTKIIDFNLKDIYLNKFTIVLAEPGNGKSRFLKELVIQAKENQYNAIFIDLKSIGQQKIDDKIKQLLKRPTKDFKNNKEINEIKDSFFIEEFQLNSKAEKIICFDVLDEVKNEITYELIDQIKQFSSDYSDLKIVISCRKFIFNKYNYLFKEFAPSFVQIEPFSLNDVNTFLHKNKFTKSEIASVTERFFRNYKYDVLNSPRILEIFVEVGKKWGLKIALEKSKSELLELFIFKELEEENRKANSNNIEITKRILEKLALTMEIFQSNEISQEDIITFFDDIESGFTTTFLQQVSINHFTERALLIPSPTSESLQFQNVEFQEFLAAKEIVRLGKVNQITFDLIVDMETKIIKPSWTNTLKYIIELCPNILKEIVEFICRSENIVEINTINQIIFSEESNISNLSEETKLEIFTLIFERYQSLKQYIPTNLAQKLALYFVDTEDNQLEKYNDINDVEYANVIHLVGYLIKDKKLKDSDYWRKLLISLVKKESNANHLKDEAIMTLSFFKDLKLMKRINSSLLKKNKTLFRTYIHACSNIDANDSFTIDLFFEDIYKDFSYTSMRYDFEKINSNSGVAYFLENLNNRELFNQFLNNNYSTYKIDSILDNIQNNLTSKIIALLKDLVDVYDGFDYNERFIDGIISIIKESQKSYIIYLLKSLSIKNNYEKDWYKYNNLFIKLLNPSNTKEFIKISLDHNYNKEKLFNLFCNFEYSKIDEHQQIFESARPFFEQELIKIRDRQAENLKERNNKFTRRKDEIYNEFNLRLNLNPEQYQSAVFSFYNNHKEDIKNKLTISDKRKIKYLINKKVFRYDFNAATIKIEKGENKRVSISRIIPEFTNAVYMLEDFEFKPLNYRNKLLEVIPYVIEVNDMPFLNFIFKKIGSLSATEIKKLLKFYNKDRQDDLFEENIRNLFETVKYFKIHDATKFLKAYVLNTRNNYENRIRALKLINELKPETSFNKLIFEKFSKKEAIIKETLSSISNEFLINHNKILQEEALNWRLKVLISNPILYSNNSRGNSIDINEISFKMNQFHKPLKAIDDLKFLNSFDDLLKKSMAIFENGIDYRSYAAFLWDIAFNYFDNLKVHGSYIHLQNLESILLKFSKHDGFSMLKKNYENLKINYTKHLSKPKSFTECILKYNEIRKKKYLSVTSSSDFYYIIQDIIQTDIKKWVEVDGAYKMIKDVGRKKEDLIQKTIKTQFENSLLKRGFRENEVHIRREEQLLDNKRTDFVLSFGFIGQILIEIKLSSNPETNSKTYYKKLINYIEGTKSDYGIFLIFATSLNKKWTEINDKILNINEPFKEKIKVIGLDCNTVM